MGRQLTWWGAVQEKCFWPKYTKNSNYLGQKTDPPTPPQNMLLQGLRTPSESHWTPSSEETHGSVGVCEDTERPQVFTAAVEVFVTTVPGENHPTESAATQTKRHLAPASRQEAETTA